MKHRRILSSETPNLSHFFSIVLQTALQFEINLERRWKTELRGEQTRKGTFVNNRHVTWRIMITCPLFTFFPFPLFSPWTFTFHHHSWLILNCNDVCYIRENKIRQIGCFAAENSAVFHNSHLTIQVLLDRARPGTSYALVDRARKALSNGVFRCAVMTKEKMIFFMIRGRLRKS